MISFPEKQNLSPSRAEKRINKGVLRTASENQVQACFWLEWGCSKFRPLASHGTP